MGKVSWSDQAKAELAELESRYPGVTRQLKRCAGKALHPVSSGTADRAEEGIEGEIMWHRGDGHGEFTRRRGRGPQDFFLFYRMCDSAPGSTEPKFEVLAVRSVEDVAITWLKQTGSDSPDAAGGLAL